MMRFACLLLLAMGLACGGSGDASTATPDGPPATGTWTLTWSDEFNLSNGSAPDPTKWVSEQGGGGWGNNELQSYTNRPTNVQIQDGSLVITAQKETYTGSDGITRAYTSARLKTQGIFSQQGGRFEARIKVPTGMGIWPAFWMLGNDLPSVGWPTCGEIDIMEVVGKTPSVLYSTIHGPGYSGGSGIGSSMALPSGKLSDDYHVYAAEWEGTTIRFYFDGTLFATRTASELPGGAAWVFDHPFFMILNLAVGGNWPGSPDGTTTWPQRMYVDYVRVYKRS